MKNNIAARAVFEQYLPPTTVDYCWQIWQKYEFDFVVARPRQTKLGDFMARPNERERITVNANLNPYNFLITYLHEVAHLEVHRSYKRRQPAHGQAWKNHFRNLLVPVMIPDVFPETVLTPLLRYAMHPKASTSTDMPLMHALRSLDVKDSSGILMLADVAEGERFMLKNRVFVKNTTRRTRAFCTEESTKKHYLVPCVAWVKRV
jgi:SprT protein